MDHPAMHSGSWHSTFWVPVPTLQLMNTVGQHNHTNSFVALRGMAVHLYDKELPVSQMLLFHFTNVHFQMGHKHYDTAHE